jgi:hypothetical protein
MVSRLFVSIIVGVIAAALGTVGASASGCTGNPQLTLDFSQPDPAWPAGDDLSIGGGSLQMKEAANGNGGYTYGGGLVGNADICTDLSVDSAKDPTGPGAGIVFWQTDWNNYYQIAIAPNGQAGLARIQAGKVLMPIQWRAAASLKTGPKVVNNIRVTLNGNSISTYFNSQLFYTITGQQPQGGGSFGVTAWSESAQANVWTFQNMKVTDPSAK